MCKLFKAYKKSREHLNVNKRWFIQAVESLQQQPGEHLNVNKRWFIQAV